MKTYVVFMVVLTTFFGVKTATNSKQNFCQLNQCLTCVGRYCTTTCRGEECKNCPIGDCCDGSNCNICRGQKCCSTPECNDCVTTCLKKCQGTPTCHYDCFQECLPGQPNDINGNVNQSYGSPLISNKNYSPVNVTTIINITNTIRNENEIHHPIIVNSTNLNNYTGNRKSYHRKQIIISPNNARNNNYNGNTYIPNNIDARIYNPNNNFPPSHNKQNCCEVIHPEVCRTVEEQNATVCYTGKHSECSTLCISKRVHIVEDKEQPSKCIAIANRPYYFCGNFVVENCEACNNCVDTEDADCSQSADCSEKCRSSIIIEDFYNKLYRKD